MKTGSFAPPKVNIGAEGSLGLGPVSFDGKLGFGAGGYPGEGDTKYYEKLSPGGVQVGGELGLGVGDKHFAAGGGYKAEYDGNKKLGIPGFIR